MLVHLWPRVSCPTVFMQALLSYLPASDTKVYTGMWYEIRVAIKTAPFACIDEAASQAVENEISLLRTIRHPNIVLFFGTGSFSDGACICRHAVTITGHVTFMPFVTKVCGSAFFVCMFSSRLRSL